MAKYGKKAQEKVEKTMHEYKRGKLKSGRSGKKVASKKQAIAIGLSQARKEGAKVPKAPSKTTGANKSASTKSRTTRTVGKSASSKAHTKKASIGSHKTASKKK